MIGISDCFVDIISNFDIFVSVIISCCVEKIAK